MPYIPKINIENYEIPIELFTLIPERDMQTQQFLPLFKFQNTLTIATSSTKNIELLDRLQKATQMDIDIVEADSTQLKKMVTDYLSNLDKHKEKQTKTGKSNPKTASMEAHKLVIKEPKKKKDNQAEQDTSVINLVESILSDSIDNRASDIHLSPTETETLIRIRVDGKLKEYKRIPKTTHLQIVSRIKVMAFLDIAKSRTPQDGQAKLELNDKKYELRVSTLPTINGENIVIRVLDKSSLKLDLTALGLVENDFEKFKQVIQVPYGMILVTGPTGSGKTTTLYTILSATKDISKNLTTLEDPVEYQLPFIRQVQVNPQSGLTFASGLRSLLRQDPDIIMVGEIRDFETASLAVRASLTGHLVYSTLHTNDAPGVISRLIDMGVEPFLVASSVTAIMSQRLVRKICSHCKEAYKPDPLLLKRLGLPEKHTYFKGKGCSHCDKTGFLGRDGIFELMLNSDKIKKAINEKAASSTIRDIALSEGMTTLKDALLAKVLEGVTSPDEAISIAQFIQEAN